MPMYEYECAACGHRFERIQKFSDPPVEECPSCGERKVQKLLSSPAIQFKGTGWYITDYAKKGSVGAESGKESGKESKESSKESKESGKESKESTKSESKESKESKSSTPASSTASTPKASGE
jgi:putative FmdB family regulatory protein